MSCPPTALHVRHPDLEAVFPMSTDRVDAALFTLLICAGLLLAGCFDVGRKLGMQTRDIPIEDVGLVPVRADTSSVATASLQFPDVEYPEWHWTPLKLGLLDREVTLNASSEANTDGSNIEMLSGTGTGTIFCTFVIDQYPVASWALEVVDGTVVDVEAPMIGDYENRNDHEAFIPGTQIKRDEDQPSVEARISDPQLDQMQISYVHSAESERPNMPPPFPEIVTSGTNTPDYDPGDIFNAVASGMHDKAITLSVIVYTNDAISGQLEFDILKLGIFDAGQGLIG